MMSPIRPKLKSLLKNTSTTRWKRSSGSLKVDNVNIEQLQDLHEGLLELQVGPVHLLHICLPHLHSRSRQLFESSLELLFGDGVGSGYLVFFYDLADKWDDTVQTDIEVTMFRLQDARLYAVRQLHYDFHLPDSVVPQSANSWNGA